ncbi:Inner membrane protein YjfL [Wohlfahrtiimonas chitiniclastica SH04]|uniref:Inner membrane protein YjfL n=1 Tax=Wohlfahrtiimonas chitiniclastica SH04 TaxID=1261130 RepID=L8XXE5_9GAMM|nr:DUF350 domain-containing protein [Wohlfahrtiimonas chitiniclastica]ELV07435.1 Inner membrane protein YjfL [Wohlfahrtiimonas chitiniclastica SH04]
MNELVTQYVLYLQYIGIAIVMTVVFGFIYLKLTPLKEIKLIKEGNIACAISFGGALIGFCLTITSSMSTTLTLVGFLIWSLLAAIIQLLVYFVATRIVKNASIKLANNNIAVGILFSAFSISIGLINAAALS